MSQEPMTIQTPELNIPQVANNSFDMGSNSYRVGDWVNISSDLDQDIAIFSNRMWARGRELVQNNSYAAKAIKLLASDFIGDGLKPSAQSKDAKINDRVDEIWKKVEPKIMVGNRRGYYSAGQATGCKGMLQNGETLFRRRTTRKSEGIVFNDDGDRRIFRMKIQQLPARFLDADYAGTTGVDMEKYVAGVKITDSDEIDGYQIYKKDPLRWNTDSSQSVFIPATQISHCFVQMEENQVRGYSALSAVANDLRNLDIWLDSELARKQNEAGYGTFITGGEYNPRRNKKDRVMLTTAVDGNGQPVTEVKPGIITYLEAGRNVEFTNPASVGNFYEAVSTYLIGISSGLMLSYARLTGDMQKTNFAGAKFADAMYRKYVHHEYKMTLIPLMCNPIWEWFIDHLKIMGIVPITLDVPARWSQPKFTSIEPLKDIQAEKAMVDMGIKAHSDSIRDMGDEPDEVYAEIKKDRAKRKKIFGGSDTAIGEDQSNGQMSLFLNNGGAKPTAHKSKESGQMSLIFNFDGGAGAANKNDKKVII